jgi:hypothetical protein
MVIEITLAAFFSGFLAGTVSVLTYLLYRKINWSQERSK